MNSRIQRWLRQPTTIHGIAVFVATGAGIGAYYATGNRMVAAGLAGSAFSVIATLMNDTSADKSRIETLVGDAITAIATQRLGPMLPELVADASRALQPDATTVAPTTPLPAAPDAA
ncbi:MAG: hypothetical protein ABI224_14090 [Acetobacteraceae bacterium]